MCGLYLRQWRKLWKIHTYMSKHPCLYALTLLGIVIYGIIVIRSLMEHPQAEGQDVVDYIGDFLDVRLQIIDNFQGNPIPMDITLFNTGSRDILSGPWRIYFNSLQGEVEKKLDCGLHIKHVVGGLFYISPIVETEKVNLIRAGQSIKCSALHSFQSIARTDHMPNWYVTIDSGDVRPKIIQSTMSEDLTHIGTYDKPNLWKRNLGGQNNPFTPDERFKMNSRFSGNATWDENGVLPTPKSVNMLSSKRLKLDSNWVIVDSDTYRYEMRYLSEQLNIHVKKGATRSQNTIVFLQQPDTNYEDEEYELKIDANTRTIHIAAAKPPGAFYGVQTLISLQSRDRTLPSVLIRDKPRFKYRGLMVDVARNFRSKHTIKKLIDILAMYKMNKLHLHLTDDEGWRIEIPEIPELTEVGSKRCHNNQDGTCLVPSLGSGPFTLTSGSGFYSIADYREILQHASKKHIQVIPELDMPGHSMAAIFSMNYRESVKNRYRGNFKSYRLNDNMSGASSVQNWVGNAINPCLNTSYMFVKKLMEGMIELHKGIQDLQVIHIGGDEVAVGAWDNSEACKKKSKTSRVNQSDLKKVFMYTVANIAAKKGLNIGSWEDGMYQNDVGPYQRADLKPKEVFVNPWNNIWEAGFGGRAYQFANKDYKVILTLGTILYLDHPYEPDPEERGLYWATNYIDTETVFGFLPDDVFGNAVKLSNGKPTTREEVCNFKPCPSTNKPHNIVGVQTCIWGELIRTDEQLYQMLFPRLLAVAERSWHKASWEDITNIKSRDREKNRDFASFAKLLGQKELPRLEKLGISYRLPIPGAVISGSKMYVNTIYPNHRIMYSIGNKEDWKDVLADHVDLPSHVPNLYLKTMSKFSGKSSRVIMITDTDNNAGNFHSSCTYMIIAIICLLGLRLCLH